MMWLSAISGAHETTVRVLEREEPRALPLQGDVWFDRPGQRQPVSGWQTATQTPTYEAQGILSGAGTDEPLRFVEGVAKTLINQGWTPNRGHQAGEPQLATVQPASPCQSLAKEGMDAHCRSFGPLLARIRSSPPSVNLRSN